jgi:predicted nuclease of predicted toxin-antitoxin system
MQRTRRCLPMRILFDENLPVDLADKVSGHHVVTVRDAGWAGIQNGKLLRLANEHYAVFVTMDRSLEHQQNLAALRLRIILKRALSNRMIHLNPLIEALRDVLRKIKPGQLVSIGI